MLTKGKASIAQGQAFKAKISDIWQGAFLVFQNKWLWFKSSIFGYVVGLIPGVGGNVATFGAYGYAKQTSKNPEKFGTGCIEGVIAPESANNSKEAGGLLTTMAFGIPGTPVMALLLGAFFMVGITPGPAMMQENLPLVFALFIGVALANIIGGVICLTSANHLSRVAYISLDILFPLLLVIIFVGAFSTKLQVGNVLLVTGIGLLGFIMTRLDYSRPALLLGFVLGELFEHYFLHSILLFGPLFWVTPISLTIIAIIVVLYGYPAIKKSLARGGKG
jgi:TctA family transporter